MKAKQINDTTVKITISLNDLEERGMELADFLMPKEKTEEFFYTVLDEVDLPDQFKLSGMLSFRVTPKQDRVDIFVTKSDEATAFNLNELANMADVNHLSPEEFFKNLEQTMAETSDKDALARLESAEQAEADLGEAVDDQLDYVHYVLSFRDLEELIAFAKRVTLPVEASELYKYQGGYQLAVLFHVENKPVNYPSQIYARLLESATESTYTRAYLREHAVLLHEGYILDELAAI